MSGNDEATWEAVSALLDELLEADAERREARLSQVRAQNPALAEQVSELLARQPAINAERFLDKSVVALLDLEKIAGSSVGPVRLPKWGSAADGRWRFEYVDAALGKSELILPPIPTD